MLSSSVDGDDHLDEQTAGENYVFAGMYRPDSVHDIFNIITLSLRGPIITLLADFMTATRSDNVHSGRFRANRHARRR